MLLSYTPDSLAPRLRLSAPTLCREATEFAHDHKANARGEPSRECSLLILSPTQGIHTPDRGSGGSGMNPLFFKVFKPQDPRKIKIKGMTTSDLRILSTSDILKC